MCNIVFKDITGIVQPEKSNISMVEYTIERTFFSEFGKIVKKLSNPYTDPVIINKSETFMKYDDGWRLIK